MFFFFFFNDTATTEIYTLSLHDALPICLSSGFQVAGGAMKPRAILLGAVAIALGCGGCGKREESLSLLVWEGYADESAVDRKSTRLNSSHGYISYAVFCLKKKKTVHIVIMIATIAINSTHTRSSLKHATMRSLCRALVSSDSNRGR